MVLGAAMLMAVAASATAGSSGRTQHANQGAAGYEIPASAAERQQRLQHLYNEVEELKVCI